jgi:hypothetical protein
MAQNYSTLMNNIENMITALIIINVTKIFNQSAIIKYSRRNNLINLNKLLLFDVITDIIKMIFSDILLVNQNNVRVNIPMYVLLIIVYINYTFIILHLTYKLYNYIKTKCFNRNNNVIHVVETEYVEIHVPIENNFMTYNIIEINNITCPICLEEQKINEEWSKLFCNHEFHYLCLKNWLRINNNCPVCRQPINNLTNSNNLYH